MAIERDLSEHFEALRKDIAALTETVGQLVFDTAGIQARVKSRVTALGSDVFAAATKQANAAVSSVETRIARNPLIAVLIALGFGFLISLIRRR